MKKVMAMLSLIMCIGVLQCSMVTAGESGKDNLSVYGEDTSDGNNMFVNRIASVSKGERLKNVYLYIYPKDDIKSGDSITITINNGTFNNIDWSGKYVSPLGYTYDDLVKEFTPQGLMALLWLNMGVNSNQLPYKIEPIGKNKIQVDLFPVRADMCERGVISVGIPYYKICLDATSGDDNVSISVNNRGINIPSGFETTIAKIKGGSEVMEPAWAVDDTKVSKCKTVKKGTYINDVNLQITPMTEIFKDDYIIVTLNNAVFDESKFPMPKYLSGLKYSYDDIMKEYDEHILLRLLAANMGSITDELPYKVQVLNKNQMKVELFPISERACNEPGQICAGIPFYNIPINAIADGTGDVTIDLDYLDTAVNCGYGESFTIGKYTEWITAVGDADDDGEFGASDAAMVMQKVLNSSFVLPTEGSLMEICDVDGDGILTATDASMIMQKVLNSSFVFEVEK